MACEAHVELPGIHPAVGFADEQEPIPHHDTLTRLEWLSYLFDEAVEVPFTKFRLGWDAVLGLIPIAGDALTAGLSAYYMWEAYRLGVRRRVLVKMLGNTLIDFAAGTVPVVGDLADVAWRSNRKNMHVLLHELQTQGVIQDNITAERIARLLGEQTAKQRRLQARKLAEKPHPFIMP